MVLALIILFTVLVSLMSFVGAIFLFISEKLLERVLLVTVAFASGVMLGGAFLHLLPESFSSGTGEAFLLVLFGIVLFFAMEKFLRWRHCHNGRCDIHAFAYLNLFGDAIHNWVDGMIIAASFLTGMDLGIVAVLLVITHEVPQEIGDFCVLVYGGLGRVKALFYNFLSQTTAIFGAVFTYALVQYAEHFTSLLLPLAAGGFIYIATTDLLPELHKRENIRESTIQLFLLSVGIILMWSLKIVFG